MPTTSSASLISTPRVVLDHFDWLKPRTVARRTRVKTDHAQVAGPRESAFAGRRSRYDDPYHRRVSGWFGGGGAGAAAHDDEARERADASGVCVFAAGGHESSVYCRAARERRGFDAGDD